MKEQHTPQCGIQIEALRDMITNAIHETTDEELLDLVWKILMLSGKEG